MQNIDKLRNENFIKVVLPSDIINDEVSQYVKKATELNNAPYFNFFYPKNIDINDDLLNKLLFYKKVIKNLNFLEKNEHEYCFSLIPVPYVYECPGKNSLIKRGITDIHASFLGTSGNKMAGEHFLRIYSNWQLSEIKTEPYLLNEVCPGWYLFSRGTLVDFCNLSTEDQLKKMLNHQLMELIKEDGVNYLNNLNKLLPEVYIAHTVGCIESLAAKTPEEIPLRNGFLRTSTFYFNKARLGILGSCYGFDLDGFWAGEGPGANISVAFCRLFERF